MAIITAMRRLLLLLPMEVMVGEEGVIKIPAIIGAEGVEVEVGEEGVDEVAVMEGVEVAVVGTEVEVAVEEVVLEAEEVAAEVAEVVGEEEGVEAIFPVKEGDMCRGVAV